jgi:hypothetical protein
MRFLTTGRFHQKYQPGKQKMPWYGMAQVTRHVLLEDPHPDTSPLLVWQRKYQLKYNPDLWESDAK